jgi:antitoxin ParD1/3/4
MNVSLTPELERLVNEKVESGLYQTASEVVREALRLLKERDHAREQLRADVQAGFDQLARARAVPTTRLPVGNSPSGSSRAVVRLVLRSRSCRTVSDGSPAAGVWAGRSVVRRRESRDLLSARRGRPDRQSSPRPTRLGRCVVRVIASAPSAPARCWTRRRRAPCRNARSTSSSRPSARQRQMATTARGPVMLQKIHRAARWLQTSVGASPTGC